MVELSLLVAFLAGIISFLSPCVLPLIPGYLAYLSGVSLAQSEAKGRYTIFVNSVFFVLGFSVVFAAIGVLLNSILVNVAYDLQTWLARIGGAIIIFFGLYLTGLIRIRYLERQRTVAVRKKFNSHYLTSFVFGSAFAAGWTPCVGAALGAILGLAASNPTFAFPLLVSYSLGLGVPFLMVGFFTSRASNLINTYAKKLTYVNVVFGVFLIILGVLVFTESLNRLANFELLNRFLLGV